MVNLVTETIIEVVTIFERRLTHTHTEMSLVYKMTLFKFLSTCVIPLAGNSNENTWFAEHGLIEEVTFVVITIFTAEILRVALFPLYLAKFVVRYWEERKGEKSDITQKEANYLFDNDKIMLGTSMSVMLVFAFVILFYIPLMPGLNFIGVVGVISLYWTLKIVILRRNVVRKQLDGKLLIHSVGILKLTAFIYAFLNLWSFYKVFHRVDTPSLMGIVIASLFMILPVRSYLVRKYTQEQNMFNKTKTYYSCFKALKHYDVHNPVTSFSGLQRLKGRNLKDAIRR